MSSRISATGHKHLPLRRAQLTPAGSNLNQCNAQLKLLKIKEGFESVIQIWTNSMQFIFIKFGPTLNTPKYLG